MKRSVISLVVLALALAFFGLAQPAPAEAQTWCLSTVSFTVGATGNYRIEKPDGTVIAGPVNVSSASATAPATITFTIGNYSGPAFLVGPASIKRPFNVTCNCSKLSVTVELLAGNYTAAIFRNGNPIKVFSVNVSSGTQTVTLEVDAPPDSSDTEYRYRVIRTATSVTVTAAEGTLQRNCDAAQPCGVGSGPLGQMTRTVPLYTTPGGAPSTFVAEAGKTFKTHGTQSGFTRISLACQFFWVPSDAIALCADPLCR